MSYIYLLKQEWKFAVKTDKFKIILTILLHSLSNVGIIIFPLFFKALIDSIKSTENTTLSNIIFWLLMLLLSFIFFEVFHRSARLIEYSVGSRVRENCVDHLYRHVYNLPLKWHQKNHSGDTINRIRLASESLFRFIENQFNFIATVILAVGPFISLCFIAKDIALLIGILVAISLFINHKLDRILMPVVKKRNDNLHSFTAVLFDFVSNIETLITLGIGKQTETVIQQKSKKVSECYIYENRATQLKCQIMSILGFILEIGVVGYYIISRFNTGNILIGTVVLIHQYCSLVKKSTLSFSFNYYDLIKWAVDFSAVDHILKGHTARNEFLSPEKKTWKKLEIKNLSFNYPVTHPGIEAENREVFNNLAISLNSNGKHAITGASGSGKSTLFKLLRGLYTPQNVKLQIDSSYYNDLTPMNTEVTLIPQLQDIFENTIEYNITLGNDIDKEDLERVIHASTLEPLLKRLKNGLKTDIREKGVNLSGGERQRIALARGLMAAKNSSIILLDEITSNIDMETEKIIFKRIFELYNDRCIIASIHRLYLIDMFESVINLDELKILQR